MNKDEKIYIAGHTGLAGSSLVRALTDAGYTNLLLRSRVELDLVNQAAVALFFAAERPDYVFLAAGKVGGILANNTYPAEFLYQNLMIETNVIHAAWQTGVKRLLFLGSSCIYPKFAPQPMKEEHLLTGELEPTNEPYAVAKIAGIKMCQAYNRQYGTRFYSVMPTNLYGPHDNFDLQTSHVLPALLRKFDDAREMQLARGTKSEAEDTVVVWGTGMAKREFLHVDDLADACVFVMNLPEETFSALLTPDAPHFLNIGTGEDVTIRELVEIIREVVGFEDSLRFDTEKPDGTPRKLLDVSRLRGLGWSAKIGLEEGIKETYRWYRAHKNHC